MNKKILPRAIFQQRRKSQIFLDCYKNKGFVFTVDAVFAIIVSLFLISALVSMQQTEKGKEKMFETTAQKARDKAMIEIYMPSNIGDSPSAEAEYYYSTNIIKYEIPIETVMPRPPIDVALVIDVSESMAEQDIFYYTMSAQNVSGGTCNGGGDCSNPGDCDSPDPNSMQLLGQINIEPENPLFAIRKDVSTYGTYSGNCPDGPRTLIKSPPPTSVYYDFSANSNNCTTPSQPPPLIAGSCCYGETGTGNCTNVTSTIGIYPKLQTGIWTIYGWADQPTDFSQTDFFITKMDATKKVAKNFLDNPGWKNQDTFGLVGFSSDAGADQWTTNPCKCCSIDPDPSTCGCSSKITTCMTLKTDRAPVKAEIDKMAPVHGTSTPAGIETASSILSAGTNKRYIVLLTDGKYNNVPLLLTTAENARSAGITIYAVGFAAADKIKTPMDPADPDSRTFEDVLIEAVKDRGSSYCPDPSDPAQLCGKYFFAATGTELNDVYQAIAGELTKGEIGTQGEITTVKKIGS